MAPSPSLSSSIRLSFVHARRASSPIIEEEPIDTVDTLKARHFSGGGGRRPRAHHRHARSSSAFNLTCPSASRWAKALDLPSPKSKDTSFIQKWHEKGCWCRWKDDKKEGTEDALECDAVEHYYHYTKNRTLVRGEKKTVASAATSTRAALASENTRTTGSKQWGSEGESWGGSGSSFSNSGSSGDSRGDSFTAAVATASGSSTSGPGSSSGSSESFGYGSSQETVTTAAANATGATGSGTSTSTRETATDSGSGTVGTGTAMPSGLRLSTSASAAATGTGASVESSIASSAPSFGADNGNSLSSSSHTLGNALGGAFGGLVALTVLVVFALVLVRTRKKAAPVRESFAAFGSNRRRFSQFGGYGATLAGGAAAVGQLSPEEPDDLRYSATGSGLLNRLRGTTDSLTRAGLAAGASPTSTGGLVVGSQHDGTDPFSDAKEVHAARLGDAAVERDVSIERTPGQEQLAGAVVAGGRMSERTGSILSYPRGSVEDNGGGASSGQEEAVRFGSSTEEEGESWAGERHSGTGSGRPGMGGRSPADGMPNGQGAPWWGGSASGR